MTDAEKPVPETSPQGGDTVRPSEETLESKLEKFQFYRSEIKHEFTLLSDRVSSCITSQSFLVVGFAISMGNTNPDWGSMFRLLFPVALATLGLTSSLHAVPGIRAACEVIHRWRDQQEQLFADDPRMEDYYVHRRRSRSQADSAVDTLHERSLLFSQRIPWIFTVAWLFFGALAIGLRLSE